jgi:hypothetical protein
VAPADIAPDVPDLKPIGKRMYTYVDNDGNTYYSDAKPASSTPVPRQLTAANTIGKQMIPFLSTLMQRHHAQQPEPEPAAEPEI